MATLASKIVEVQAALDALAKQHKVPGASLGIMSGDERVEFATGVANLNTGAPVTTSTLFQIGSNTKVYTATLVMQLVDDGLVDLDAPVKGYLPGFELADRKARDAITVRMLLTHTSGIEGDYFEDYGRGDDGIERYVESLKDIGQIHSPTEMWSYCNSGWMVLGRLVEVLREQPYHQVLRERLLTPIGAHRTTVLMEEMLATSCAVGHMVPPGGAEPIVPPSVMMSPSQAPAGSMTASTPAEVLAFVRMHLDGGRARDGMPVLSVKTAKAMQQPQAKLPRSSLGDAMGLGRILADWDGERMIGHGGGTIGQLSFLHALPDRRFAVILMTNSSGGAALWRDLGRYVFSEFAGVHVPEIPKLPEVPPKLDLTKYAGQYRREAIEMELKAEDGKLVAEIKGTGPLASLAPPQTAFGRPIDREVFLINISGADTIGQFMEFDRGGRPRYLHVGGRVSRRIGDGAVATAKRKPAAAKRRAKPKAKPKRKATASRRRR